MVTVYNDVWEGLLNPTLMMQYDILIASPPCQTFSIGGYGAGRRALNNVLEAIEQGDYIDPARLYGLTTELDPRTALVLTPLAHVYRDQPTYVVFEQVPAVLPVWEACAPVLENFGYSVVTGIITAEQYGTPQVRRRAVLIARKDGVPAAFPAPTHSRYHSKMIGFFDPGVFPWVSMYDVLGWGLTTRPCVTLGNSVGRGLAGGSGARRIIERAIADGSFVVSPFSKGNGYSELTRIHPNEAGVLQGYPKDFKWKGTRTRQFLQIGNAVPPPLAKEILKMFLPKGTP
jgi:DNA (cytosine-5)-methyltransferase 1